VTIKDIRPALFAYLMADAGISAAVEGAVILQNGGSRIFPMRLPAGIKKDSIVYTRVSGEGDHHMEGPSGLARVRMQIDAWSKTIPGAVSLANLVKERIDGFRGVMGSGAAAVTIQGIFFESEREDYDDVAELNRVSRDYFIVYEER